MDEIIEAIQTLITWVAITLIVLFTFIFVASPLIFLGWIVWLVVN